MPKRLVVPTVEYGDDKLGASMSKVGDMSQSH